MLTLPVLPGLDGVQRMSKSLGNYVGVTDAPAEMFGKVMSLPDAVMPIFWRLVDRRSRRPTELVDEMSSARTLADPAVNPMTVKKRLGAPHRRACTTATRRRIGRRRDFETQFSRREVPEYLEDLADACRDARRDKAMGIKDLLVAAGLARQRQRRLARWSIRAR